MTSREKLFAAQFLGVSMFLLFLPGVSRSDSSKGKDCDARCALDSAFSSKDGREFDGEDKSKKLDDDKAMRSHHGKAEGPGFGSQSTGGDDSGSGDRVPAASSIGSLPTGSPGDILGASASLATVPEPEVIPLLLLGGLFLIARRILPFGGRLRRWLAAPMGGHKFASESRELEIAPR